MAVWKISGTNCMLALLCVQLATALPEPTRNAMSDTHFLLSNFRPVEGLVECSAGTTGEIHLYQPAAGHRSRRAASPFAAAASRLLRAVRYRDDAASDVISDANDAINRVRRFRLSGRVRKRHCWDVSDVCCMWNVC